MSIQTPRSGEAEDTFAGHGAEGRVAEGRVAHEREPARKQSHEQGHSRASADGTLSGSTDQQGHEQRGEQRGEQRSEERREAQVSPIRALIESATERILADLSLGEPTEMEAYLGVLAAFPNFSLYNQHLVFMQCPKATLLGEFEAWQGYGFSVLRGSRAIRLLDGKTPIALFDVSQTRARGGAEPLPLFRAKAAKPYALYERLTTHLLSVGVIDPDFLTDVRPESDPEAVAQEIEYFMRGYADHVLQASLPARIDRARIADCHVEAVAYVVLRHLGLEAVYPANDLERWGKTPRALREELELVRRMSAAIISEVATYAEDAMAGTKIRHINYALE